MTHQARVQGIFKEKTSGRWRDGMYRAGASSGWAGPDSLALGGLCHPCGAEGGGLCSYTVLQRIHHHRATLDVFPFVYGCRPHTYYLKKKGHSLGQIGSISSNWWIQRLWGLLTSLSRPRSSDMCVISRVLGLGHFTKYDSRAERTVPSKLVLRFLFLVSTNTRSILYIWKIKKIYNESN